MQAWQSTFVSPHKKKKGMWGSIVLSSFPLFYSHQFFVYLFFLEKKKRILAQYGTHVLKY